MTAVPDSDALPLDRRSLYTYLGARFAATQAFHIFLVSVGWHLYELTGSALDLGLIGLFQFLPTMAMLLVVGHVVDHYDRIRVLRVVQALSAISVAALAITSHGGLINRELIFAFVFVYSITRAFEGPAQQAILPSLVPPRQLPRAIAAASSMQELGSIIGPAVGGLLCMIAPEAAYAAVAVLYLLSVGLLALPQPTHAPARGTHQDAAKDARAILGNLFAGFAYVRKNPVLLGAMTLDMAATLLGGVWALLPVVAKDILQVDAWGLGLLRSASALGAMAMAATLTRWPLQSGVGRKLFISVAIYGLSVIVFGLSHTFWLSFLALIVLGASDNISVVVRGSLAQLETPNEMRGRVGAVSFTFINISSQIGQLETGIAAALLGTVPAIVVGGVGAIAVAGIWMRLFPPLLQRDRLHQH
ncbi:MAG TPA: MFS transporter [Rhodocyclaceae bacterium]|nr:MFS transporter [Rhodocyclaceae bacterium]